MCQRTESWGAEQEESAHWGSLNLRVTHHQAGAVWGHPATFLCPLGTRPPLLAQIPCLRRPGLASAVEEKELNYWNESVVFIGTYGPLPPTPRARQGRTGHLGHSQGLVQRSWNQESRGQTRPRLQLGVLTEASRDVSFLLWLRGHSGPIRRATPLLPQAPSP